MTILPLLFGTLVASIAAQDAKTLVFPPNGNGTSLEMGSKIEPALQPDMTLAVPTTLVVPPSQQPMLPSDYFFPMPQQTFLHHRSENMPYGNMPYGNMPYGNIPYEYPNIGYPVVQSMDQSVVPSSKQLLIVSFIGLLLLLAILQNTLSSAKSKDAIMDLLSSRQKRDVYATHDFRSVTPEEEEILNNDARVRCIQRTICLENRKLFRDLGAPGKILAKHLTRDVEKSFKSPTGWDRLVKDAGAAGIRGDDCDVLYRDCDIPVTRKMHKVSDSVLKDDKDRDKFNSIR